MRIQDLMSVKELAESSSAFSESSLRWLLFNADKSGLDRALVKVGRRVLIDVPEFERWLEAGRVAELETAPFREAG